MRGRGVFQSLLSSSGESIKNKHYTKKAFDEKLPDPSINWAYSLPSSTPWQATSAPESSSLVFGISIVQRSFAYSHRPWKMQPGGRFIGVVTSPFNLICFGFFSPNMGIALKSAFVYGCRFDTNSSLTEASSHNVPRYITATLVLIWFKTDRTWVINS